MPPFIGPRALSCCTRKPTNDAKLPSSLGMVHSTCEEHGGTHEQTIRPTRTVNKEDATSNGAGRDPHLDLPERDEQALLELRVEAEQLGGPPEVAAGGGERVHLGGNFFQEEGFHNKEGSRGRGHEKDPPFQHRRQKQQARATRARSGRPKNGRRRDETKKRRRLSSEGRGGRAWDWDGDRG